MYAAAYEIMKELIGKTREEIRLEKIRTQKEVSEEEVKESLSQQRMILNKIYSQEELRVGYINITCFTSKPLSSCVSHMSLYLHEAFSCA